MQDAARIVVVLGVSAGVWLVGFCCVALRLGGSSAKFYGGYQSLVGRCRESVEGMMNGYFPG